MEGTQIKGTVVYKGKVRGRVKILYSKDDVDKFKKGELKILQSRPITTL